MLAASGVVHIVVWLVSGAPSLEGPVSWRKPIEFGLSGGGTALTLAWVLGRLPRSSIVDWMIAIGVAFFVAEAALIDVQQWRGVPSHFNVRTPLDAAIFDAMAVCIGFVGLAIALVAVRSFGRVSGGPATALAIRTGFRVSARTAPLALSPLALLASLVGAALIAGPYLRGLIALRRPSLA